MFDKYSGFVFFVVACATAGTALPSNGLALVASVLGLAITIGLCNRYGYSWLAIAIAAFLFIMALYVLMIVHDANASPEVKDLCKFGILLPFMVLMTLCAAACWRLKSPEKFIEEKIFHRS